MTTFHVQTLDDGDRGYALSSWRESHKAAPVVDRIPWSYYKHEYGTLMARVINDDEHTLLGAYNQDNKLLGWLAMTRGRSVNTLHWVHVKHKLGNEPLRRRGLMYALIDTAELGSRFVYTMRARRNRAPLPDGAMSKSLDESLAAALLRDKGTVATYVAMKDWFK